MSASEVAPNPFWYAKLTAAQTSRDCLSICVLAMLVCKSVIQLNMTSVGKPVKPPACFWAAAVLAPARGANACVRDGSPQGGDGFGSVYDSPAPKADAQACPANKEEREEGRRTLVLTFFHPWNVHEV